MLYQDFFIRHQAKHLTFFAKKLPFQWCYSYFRQIGLSSLAFRARIGRKAKHLFLKNRNMGDKELERVMARSMHLLLMVNVGNPLPRSLFAVLHVQKRKQKGSFPSPCGRSVHTGGLEPRPQYEEHLGIDGGQSSFFFGISTGEHEKKTGRGLRYQRP